MPKIRTSRKRMPKGFDRLEETLTAFEQKMRDAEDAPHEGKRRAESTWAIFRIHHQRSRYIYEQYYFHKAISRELYEWLLRENYADKHLIAKWKKPGYERLCCLKCMSTKDHNFQTTCICRVPAKDLEPGKVVECVHCGCRGCASQDGAGRQPLLSKSAAPREPEHAHAHAHEADEGPVHGAGAGAEL